MTREKRIELARETLWTEHSKEIFDKLIVLYPDAAIFWDQGDDGECVLLQFKEGSTISIAGYN